jgi:hypothetical protein
VFNHGPAEKRLQGLGQFLATSPELSRGTAEGESHGQWFR